MAVDIDWDEALCRGMPDLFFSPYIDSRIEPDREVRETKCRSICFRCPIRYECLRVAVADRESFGVWGGMPEGERMRFTAFLRRHRIMYVVEDPDEFKKATQMFYELEHEEYEIVTRL
jgi:WhiB family transcriptional regulator, redox-sensing transcriptional regulator